VGPARTSLAETRRQASSVLLRRLVCAALLFRRFRLRLAWLALGWASSGLGLYPRRPCRLSHSSIAGSPPRLLITSRPTRTRNCRRRLRRKCCGPVASNVKPQGMPPVGLLSNLFGRTTAKRDPSSSVSCCSRPELGDLVDFGHARSFDFMYTTCRSCGVHWLNVFSVATGITGYERVSDGDARALLSATPGSDRKELLKRWADEHL
jgi:hypothetical protein